jgi:hypothetical protein
MRFLSLLSFLLVLKCGSGPTPDVDVTANDVVAEQEESVATTPAESEAEVAAASADVEEAEEVLRIWDRAWPEAIDRQDLVIKDTTGQGMELHRIFVSDTVNQTPDQAAEDRVDAIFVALLDFAAGENASVNKAINTELLKRLVDNPKKAGTPGARLRATAKQAIKAFRKEQAGRLEEDQMPNSFRQAATTTVWLNDASFLVMTLENYEYGGGANGGFYRDDLSFSTQTGRLIKLTDLIAREQRTAFTKELHALALAEGHDAITEAADFPMPDNFLFTKEGMSFHYPEYSETLSNRWMVDLVVPYDRVSDKLTELGKRMMLAQAAGGEKGARLRSLGG